MIRMMKLFIIGMALTFSISLSNEKGEKSDIAKKLAYIPGAGQVYNKEYLKGFMLFSSELYSIFQINKFSKPAAGVINISKRNTFIWWAIGIYVYSVIDAHVESELSSFPDEDNVLNEEEK